MNLLKSLFCKHEYLIHAIIPTLENEVIVGLVCRKCLQDTRVTHHFYSKRYNEDIEKMLITNKWITLNKNGSIKKVHKEKNINVYEFKDMLKQENLR